MYRSDGRLPDLRPFRPDQFVELFEGDRKGAAGTAARRVGLPPLLRHGGGREATRPRCEPAACRPTVRTGTRGAHLLQRGPGRNKIELAELNARIADAPASGAGALAAGLPEAALTAPG